MHFLLLYAVDMSEEVGEDSFNDFRYMLLNDVEIGLLV